MEEGLYTVISIVTKISLPSKKSFTESQTLACYNNAIRNENFITETN